LLRNRGKNGMSETRKDRTLRHTTLIYLRTPLLLRSEKVKRRPALREPWVRIRRL
jgi:hypothetical protein